MPVDVYERLTELLRAIFDDDSIEARPTLTADQVAGWDSFAHLRVIFAVEKEFGVSFAASQIASLKNVGELVELINAKMVRSPS